MRGELIPALEKDRIVPALPTRCHRLRPLCIGAVAALPQTRQLSRAWDIPCNSGPLAFALSFAKMAWLVGPDQAFVALLSCRTPTRFPERFPTVGILASRLERR